MVERRGDARLLVRVALTVVLVFAAVLVVPAPAHAAGTITIGGPPVTVVLPPGQTDERTFQWDGSARVYLIFDDCFNMRFNVIYGDGFSDGHDCGGAPSVPGDGDFAPFTPRAPGTHRITFEADTRGTGEAGFVTITLRAAAPEHTGTMTVGGLPVRVEFGGPFEAAWLSFDGIAGQSVTLQLTAAATTPHCWTMVWVRRPDGQLIPTGGCFPGSNIRPLGILPQTGRYRVEIDRFAAGTGAGSLTAQVVVGPPSLPVACLSGRVSPIALVHGQGGSTGGFSDMAPFLVERVRQEFLDAGVPAADARTCAPRFVTAIAVGPQASSDANSAVLTGRLNQLAIDLGITPIDIITHSKGGLDARTALVKLSTVRNLVMIGTPNGGTRLADFVCSISNFPLPTRPFTRLVTDRLAGPCRGPQDAVFGLTRDFVRQQLNPRVPDNGSVLYQTIAGDSDCVQCRVLRRVLGANDSRVPVSSVQYLADRGHRHITAGVFPDDHTGLLHSQAVFDRAYCSLVPRGRHYPPCDVVPSGPSAQAVPAPETDDGLLHVDAAQAAAGGTISVSLPIGGRGEVDVDVITDQTAGVTASAGGVAFTAEQSFGVLTLSGHLQSAADVPLTITNSNGTPASAVIMVTGGSSPGLDVRLTPEVAAPNRAVQVRVVHPPGGAAPAAGLTGVVAAPDDAETQLAFTASGTDAVAAYTPPAAGDYRVSIMHQGTARRIAFRLLAVGSGGASLPGTFTAAPATGADGLADALNVDVAVVVTQAGTYTVSAGLAAPDGSVIATAEATAALTAGQRQVRLPFRGPVLYAAAKDGPYRLVDLTLFRTGADGVSRIEARVAATAGTAAYPSTAFRPATVVPGSVSITEGTGGTAVVEFPVTLSERVNVPVTADFASIEPDGAATWPEDYDPVWSRLTFLPGEIRKTVELTIRRDAIDEPDEMAMVSFYAATHAKIGGFGGVGGVSIVDDDAAPVIQPGFVSVGEGNSGTKVVQVPVTLSAPSGRTITVNYGSQEPPGYATWPEDYAPVLGTLTFRPGETSKTIPLTINGDTLDEPDEMALTGFSGPTNATVGGLGVAGVTIVDDD